MDIIDIVPVFTNAALVSHRFTQVSVGSGALTLVLVMSRSTLAGSHPHHGGSLSLSRECTSGMHTG